MKILRAGLLIATFVFLLAGCSFMPVKPETASRGDYRYTREYISWLIRQEMADKKVTGLSIALVDDQKVVWAEGFGYADLAKGVTATPDTIYRSGSISKLFTATAAMQLVDDRLLNIDKPLQRYLPEFTIKSRFPDAAPITPRNLMTQHSGLPADLLKGMWTRRPASLAEEMLLLQDEYAANPPDYVFAPSNVGMTLLGHAVEKIVERDFAAQVGLSLFMPLRMTNSAFSAQIDHSPLASKAYRNNEELVETPLRDIPAAGLNSSVVDLSRFISMIFADGWYRDRQVLKSSTLAEMLRPQNSRVPLDLSLRVGLGWMLDDRGSVTIRNAGPVAHLGGATLYHRSQLIILPGQKLGVVVLANSASSGSVVNKVAQETLKLALEAKAGITQTARPKEENAELQNRESREQLMHSLEAKYGVVGAISPQQAAKSTVPKEERKPLTAAELQAYEGSYDTIAGLVQMKNKLDYLESELFNRTIRLTPRPDGLLGMSSRFLGLFTISLGDLDQMQIDREMVKGRDILKTVIDGNEFLAGERLKPGPIPDKWRQRAGEYVIVNAEDDTVLVENIRLRCEGEVLTVEYAMPLFSEQTMSVALAPLSDSEALICGLGRGKGETVRVITKNKEELLAYSGYLLRKKME